MRSWRDRARAEDGRIRRKAVWTAPPRPGYFGCETSPRLDSVSISRHQENSQRGQRYRMSRCWLAVLGATVFLCSMAGTGTSANAASIRANQITAAFRESSGQAHADGVLLDPICRAFFKGNPPILALVHGKLTVSGSSEYPGCEGSAKNKALTTRQGEICLQVHEGTIRRGTWRNVKCSTETFPTRAFGTYTLTAGRVCPAHRHVHQYRMWQWLYLQRGALTNKASGIGPRKFIKC